jgi:Bacterial regulatory proteins, crp family
VQVSHATVYATPHDIRKATRYGGGPIGALRAYQSFHPDAAIYDVTYRGRTVWMTSKQRAIWHEVNKYWLRGKRDTLERIARLCGCSRATVSRFLRRLDQWRFIDLITFRGHGGGVYVFTRRANERPRVWTKAERFAARARLAIMYRRHQMQQALEPMLARYRDKRTTAPASPLQYTFTGEPDLIGNTGATLRSTYGTRSRHR